VVDNGIERAIGRLEAEAAASQVQRGELFTSVAELREDMHKGFAEIRVLLLPLAALPGELTDHRQKIELLRSKQERQSGALWAAGVLGGLIAGSVAVLARLADVMKWLGGKT